MKHTADQSFFPSSPHRNVYAKRNNREAWHDSTASAARSAFRGRVVSRSPRATPTISRISLSLPPSESQVRAIVTAGRVDVRRFFNRGKFPQSPSALSDGLSDGHHTKSIQEFSSIPGVSEVQKTESDTKCVFWSSKTTQFVAARRKGCFATPPCRGREFEMQFGKLQQGCHCERFQCCTDEELETQRPSSGLPKEKRDSTKFGTRRSFSLDVGSEQTNHVLLRMPRKKGNAPLQMFRRDLVCADGTRVIGQGCSGTIRKPSGGTASHMGGQPKSTERFFPRGNILLSVPDLALLTIFQFLGTPSTLWPVLTSSKALYGILNRGFGALSVCPSIKITAAWAKASSNSLLMWLKFLGPFRSACLSPAVVGVLSPTSSEALSALLRDSSQTLEMLSVEVNAKIYDPPDFETNSVEGREYERLVAAELLGRPAISYRSSIEDRHALYHRALQNDIRWAQHVLRHESGLPAMRSLKEIRLSLGVWTNELHTLFDRIFSLLGELRLTQWFAMLAQIDLSSVTNLYFRWGPCDPLPNSPPDLMSPCARSCQFFEDAFLSFMRRVRNVRNLRYSTAVRHPRTPEWHQRLTDGYFPFFRGIFLHCAPTLETIHIRASPGMGGPLRKAASPDRGFPGIACPNLSVFSMYPAASLRHELADVAGFLQQILEDEHVVVHEMQPFWEFERSSCFHPARASD